MDGWDGMARELKRAAVQEGQHLNFLGSHIKLLYLSGLGYDGAAPAAEQPKAPPAKQPKRCITAHLLWPSDHP